MATRKIFCSLNIVKESQSPQSQSRSQDCQQLARLITIPISLHSPRSHIVWSTVCYAYFPDSLPVFAYLEVTPTPCSRCFLSSTAPSLLRITCKTNTPFTIQLRTPNPSHSWITLLWTFALIIPAVIFNKPAVLYLLPTFIFTFSHLADAFIQSDLQLGNT